MNSVVQRKLTRPDAHTRRQQALLVRAVVGSLVLCAAFGAPPSAHATPEIINAGEIRWNESLEKFVETLSGSDALEHSLPGISLGNDEQKFFAQVVATVEAELKAAPAIRNVELLRSRAHAATRVERVAVVLNNLTPSANGKQSAGRLEMTREQAGNLLRKHLSLP